MTTETRPTPAPPGLSETVLERLRCPISGLPLRLDGGELVSEDGARRYPVGASGIPMFAEDLMSDDARAQKEHYDRIANAYVEHLDYPHTRVYTGYLDDAVNIAVEDATLENVAEICCGRGEAFRLPGLKIKHGTGVDISVNMLESARADLDPGRFTLVQGDATALPLKDDCFDTVFMLGGIHHVNDRPALFREVARILKPGGRFCWREPVSDFFLWRWLRAIIYRLSPELDHETERPLLYRETAPVIEAAGMTLESWRTYGFFGFCLFMNSDVLIFNKLFRFIPGIRALTRLAVLIDDWTVRIPGLGNAGLQVIGIARKPGGEAQRI